MRIGITERGDAGLDLSWSQKLNTVDGAILITKNITNSFIGKVLEAHHNSAKLIIHCTCTGQGGSILEPNVPDTDMQLHNLKKLIDSGFPKEQCVLRIDPIFPTPIGLQPVETVMKTASDMRLNDLRVRVSILDEYKHVKERLNDAGLPSVYDDDRFQPNDDEKALVADFLNTQPYFDTIETCAEDITGDKIQQTGCISVVDLKILGLLDKATGKDFEQNPQQRNGCKCLCCKTELLDNKAQCPNGCLYCYWKGNCNKCDTTYNAVTLDKIKKLPGKTISFTGRRPKDLYGYKDVAVYNRMIDRIANMLEMYVRNGYVNFITGGAQGFDQMAFWAVNKLKKRGYTVNNIVFVPFKGQELQWLETGLFSQADYHRMLDAADQVVILSETNDNPIQKLHGRNHHMVNNSDLVIALYPDGNWMRNKGGTTECMRYCYSVRTPIVQIQYDTHDIENTMHTVEVQM